MAANNLPPIPQDEIKEGHNWREWFRNLGGYIQQVQLGNVLIGILQGGTGAVSPAGARNNLGVPAQPIGSSILAGNGSGEFQNVTIGTGLSYVGGTLTNTVVVPSGLSVTITTAKLTLAGANGSMTFTDGLLTSQTAAT